MAYSKLNNNKYIDIEVARAISYETAQNYRKAADIYKVILEKTGASEDVEHKLSRALFAAGNLAGAKRHYRKLLKSSFGSKRALYLKELAEVYKCSADYVNALKYYNAARAESEEDTEILKDIAKVLELKGEYRSAVDCMKKAARKGMDVSEELYKLYLFTGVTSKHRKFLEKLINDSSEVAEYIITLAESYTSAASVRRLTEKFRARIQKSSKKAFIHEQIGRILNDLGDSASALKEFKKAEKYGGWTYALSRTRISIYARSGEDEKLEKECLISLKNGASPDVLYELIKLYNSNSSYSSVIDITAEYRKIIPEETYLKIRASAFSSSGRWRDALLLYEKYISYGKDDHEVYYYAAQASERLGKNKRAGQLYKKAISICSDSPEYLCSYSQFLKGEFSFSEALKIINKAIKLTRGKQPLLIFRKAEILKDLAKYVSAEKEVIKSISLGYRESEVFTFAARLFSESGKFSESLSYYDKAIRFSKDRVLLYAERAKVFQVLGKYSQAEKDYLRSLDKSDGHEILKDLCVLYIDTVQNEKAYKCLYRLIKTKKHKLFAAENIAMLKWKEGDFKGAASFYRKAAAIDKANYLYNQYLACIFIEQKDGESAYSELKKALKKAMPENIYLAYRAKTDYFMGDFKTSLKTFRKSIVAEGNENNEINYAVAKCLEALGKYEEAYELFKDLNEKVPEDKDYILAMAKICMCNGSYRSAIDHYKNLEKLISRNIPEKNIDKSAFVFKGKFAVCKSDILRDISKLYLYEHDLKNAQLYLNRALKENGRDPALYAEIGDVHMLSEKYRDAERAYVRACELSSSGSEYLIRLGKLHEITRDYPEALKYYKKALGKDSVTDETYADAVSCMMELGDYAGAETILKKALQSFSDSDLLLYASASLYKRWGDYYRYRKYLTEIAAKDKLADYLSREHEFSFKKYKQGAAGINIDISGLKMLPGIFSKNEPFRVFFTWKLSYECNFRCEYCNVFNSVDKELLGKEIYKSPEEWYRIWKTVYDKYGSCHISITGGEPFAYPEFLGIIVKLTRIHTLELQTNMKWDTESFINLTDPGRIRISASYHPGIMKPDEYLEKLIMLRSSGYEISVSSVAYPPQISELKKIKNIFEKKGFHLSIRPYNGIFKDKQYPLSYTEQEVSDQLDIAYSLPAASANLRWSLDLKEAEKDKLLLSDAKIPASAKKCKMGMMYAIVNTDGSVERCCRNHEKLGNITDGSLCLHKSIQECSVDHCGCWRSMTEDSIEKWALFWEASPSSRLLEYLTLL